MNTVFEFPDHLKPIVAVVNKIVKQTAASYVVRREHPHMDGINKRIKVALQMNFGVKKEQVPDFKLDEGKRDIILTVAEWTSLLNRIEEAFDAATPTPKGLSKNVPWV